MRPRFKLPRKGTVVKIAVLLTPIGSFLARENISQSWKTSRGKKESKRLSNN